MNTKLILEYWPSICDGFRLTIYLSAIVLAVSTPVAFFIALGRYLRVPYLARLLDVYVTVFRALPALVVLFFAFYALPKFGIVMQPFWAAVTGMCVTTAAYVSEDFRAGIATIKKGQWEAAGSLGLSRAWTVRRIILPQALPIIIPPFMTNAIITIKATAIVSLIGVKELTGATMAAISLTYSALDFMMVAAALYLGLSAVLVLLQAAIEYALRRKFYIIKAAG